MVPDSGPEADDKDLRIPFASSIPLKDFAYWHHHAHWFRKDLYQVLEDTLSLLAEKYPIPADLQANLDVKRAIALAKRVALIRRNKK